MAIPKFARNLLVSTIGEFVGTFLFLLFGFGAAQTVNLPSSTNATVAGPDASRFLYISFAFALSLATNVWIFLRVSGAAFNPAVTLAVIVLGGTDIITAICAVAAQLSGGMLAAITIKLMLPSPAKVIHFAVSLGGGISDVQGFFIELLATFLLIITILMVAVEKTKGTFIAPFAIGLALFVCHTMAIFWTGASMNPARAFGPAVVEASFPSYEWIYWFGPFAGALLAAGLYKILKFLEYEKVNGHQDKSPDDDLAPLIEKQNDLEKQLRAWGPRRESRYGSPIISPYSRSNSHRSTRPPPPPGGLRLYTLSGLEPYISPAEGKPVMREYEYAPTEREYRESRAQSRYAKSSKSMAPEDRPPQQPREW
ncbi:hypothetical protein HYALB_00012239 [Hymenoscyphus albidus]|uniref:Aquaporin-like protein n=1 Tax=Hymenoscyphus albidus TaxID=595503 RepID=A0A9N9Q549_9HELO|nr:hypothetical protein HYALB_00012239 [Hymenoscyphus albidus]